jgi:alkylation response protein AidB-like acyl-CoA dehydrogenase
VEDVVENFYRDNPDILFHLNHLDISKVVELKEDGFSGKDQYPEAPVNLDDAMDNYDRILDITGEIAGKIIKPRAAEVDRIGAKFEKGEVILAPGTVEALERLKKSDLMGFTLPRRYGGLNFPKTIYSMAIEIISRADASLMNLFGLQEIGDTICKFGSQEQKQQFLPRFSSGEISGAMALTEPDAGSDLQTVMLKARQDDQGNWFLNGVKRFITNGCADVSLVMARSEEGTAGGRGLSLFIYERDEHLTIRRIEHKLGIHGSPTCELQFNNAPAQLLGRRKFGLIKYTLSLMNGARASVAAQAVGIAEAAYREADRYARDRVQFSKPIRQFSAIFEMLTHMKTGIEAARSLLYETSIIVDIKEGLEERIEQYPESAADLKEELKRYNRLAALFTPIVKAFASELANEVCYKAIQIHGGVGYTCEFEVERLYRDARITNIYEGTTQLQVVAAIGGVMGGVVVDWVNGFETEYDFSPVQALFDSAAACRKQLESAIAHIKEKKDGTLQEFHAARLVSIATDTIIAYLLTRDATFAERKQKVAKVFLVEALPRIKAALAYIESGETFVLELHNDIIS